MRYTFQKYGAVLLFALPLIAAEPPSTIFSRSGSPPTPIFIAATAMVTADGAPSPIVPEDWRIQQQRHAATISRLAPQRPLEASSLGTMTSATPCRGVMMKESPLEPLVDRYTKHDAIANARAIVAGTIKSITPGFFYGTPGSLIELENLEKIKLDSSYNGVHDRIYLRLPYARFVSENTEYCRESSASEYIPQTGDRLLLFAYDQPLNAEGNFVYTTSNDVIVQSAAETATRIPQSFSFFGANATIPSITITARALLSDRHVAAPNDVRAQ